MGPDASVMLEWHLLSRAVPFGTELFSPLSTTLAGHAGPLFAVSFLFDNESFVYYRIMGSQTG
jgi:hypothetical protein